MRFSLISTCNGHLRRAPGLRCIKWRCRAGPGCGPHAVPGPGAGQRQAGTGMGPAECRAHGLGRKVVQRVGAGAGQAKQAAQHQPAAPLPGMARPLRQAPGGGDVVAGHQTAAKQRAKCGCAVQLHQRGLGRVGQRIGARAQAVVQRQPGCAAGQQQQRGGGQQTALPMGGAVAGAVHGAGGSAEARISESRRARPAGPAADALHRR